MQGRTFNYLVLQHHGLGHTTKDSVLIIMPSYTTLDRLERLWPWYAKYYFESCKTSLPIALTSKSEGRSIVDTFFCSKNVKLCAPLWLLFPPSTLLYSPTKQCDQIGWLHFGQPFKAGGNNYFAQIAHILGNFCKSVKIFHFSSEIIFGKLLQTFGDFLLVTLEVYYFMALPTYKYPLWCARCHLGLLSSVTREKSPNVYKSCPKKISLEKLKKWHLYKNYLIMLEIWAN